MTWLRLRRAELTWRPECRTMVTDAILYFEADVSIDTGYCCCQTPHTLGGEQFESVFQVEREGHYSTYRDYGRFDHFYGNGLHSVG